MNARSHHIRRGLVVAAAGALLLSACAAPLPIPAADPTPTDPLPVLTVTQEENVLTQIGKTLKEADAVNDPSVLKGRVLGPALEIRTSQLAVAASLKSSKLVTLLPTDVQQLIVPTTEEWPRTSFGVSVQPEDLQSPRLMAFQQPTAREQYQLWGWVRLFPNTTMPSFADPTIGSEAVPPDDATLAVTPTDAVARYVDVLNLNAGSAYAKAFPDDPFRQFLVSYAKVQNEALKPAEGKQTMTFAAGKDPVQAIRTADGGALVMGGMTALETRTAEEGATISPVTETEKALFGKTTPKNKLNVGYRDIVAIYVPPKGSTETMRVLGTEHVATSIAVP